jgi:hypothetical protein
MDVLLESEHVRDVAIDGFVRVARHMHSLLK